MSAQLLTSLPLALAPLPDVAFILQLSALGTAVGSTVAAWARRRNPAADASRITAAWSLLGLALGVTLAIVATLAQVVA